MNLETLKINSLIKFSKAMIEFDNTDLIKLATAEADKYRDIIVKPEDVALIKKDVAYLNSLIKNLDDERKNIKKTYNEPLVIFEEKIKTVTDILMKSVHHMKTQIDDFEDKRRAEIRESLQRVIIQRCDSLGLEEIYRKQIIFDDRWLNVTAKPTEIEKSIIEKIESLKNLQDKDKALKLAEDRRKEEEFKMILDLIEIYNNANGLNIKINDFKPMTKEALMKHVETLKIAQQLEASRKEQSIIPAEIVEKIYAKSAITYETATHVADIPKTKLDEDVTEAKQFTYSIRVNNLTLEQKDLLVRNIKAKMPNAGIEVMSPEITV